MAYSSGLLRDRVEILNKIKPAQGEFGATTSYQTTTCVWANVTWLKGVKRLAESSLDAMDTVMIRMRYNTMVTRESRLRCNGVTYQIQSMHADRKDNTIQITATEII